MSIHWGRYIKNLGGCPQAIDMEAHKAALKAGLDWQVPDDFEGFVSYDMEGWDGGEANTSTVNTALMNRRLWPFGVTLDLFIFGL